jgi:hypothetical protein
MVWQGPHQGAEKSINTVSPVPDSAARTSQVFIETIASLLGFDASCFTESGTNLQHEAIGLPEPQLLVSVPLIQQTIRPRVERALDVFCTSYKTTSMPHGPEGCPDLIWRCKAGVARSIPVTTCCTWQDITPKTDVRRRSQLAPSVPFVAEFNGPLERLSPVALKWVSARWSSEAFERYDGLGVPSDKVGRTFFSVAERLSTPQDAQTLIACSAEAQEMKKPPAPGDASGLRRIGMIYGR